MKRTTALAGLAAGVAGLFLWGASKRKDEVTPMPVLMPDEEKRALIVAAARGEIGQQDAAKYWGNVLPGTTGGYPPHWCGGFTLWALHQAGVAQDINWEIGKGYCYKLPRASTPLPGDIAYFDKPYQHHAIVESVNGDTLRTIDGNQPGQSVRARTRSIAESRPVFYSIEPLLSGTV